jgi:hypothetical protein
MSLPGRCVSVATFVLNYGATYVTLIQRQTLSSRRRWDSIFERINCLGIKKKLAMCPDGA